MTDDQLQKPCQRPLARLGVSCTVMATWHICTVFRHQGSSQLLLMAVCIVPPHKGAQLEMPTGDRQRASFRWNLL